MAFLNSAIQILEHDETGSSSLEFLIGVKDIPRNMVLLGTLSKKDLEYTGISLLFSNQYRRFWRDCVKSNFYSPC